MSLLSSFCFLLRLCYSEFANPLLMLQTSSHQTNQHCCLLTLTTVQWWAASALISIYWCDGQFMHQHPAGKSIFVPQNMEVTLCVSHTYNKPKCIYTFVCKHNTLIHTHTNTLSGQGLFQDEFRLFVVCLKSWNRASWCPFCLDMWHLLCLPLSDDSCRFPITSSISPQHWQC